MYNTKSFCLGKVEEGVENDTGTKRETDKCNGPDTEMTMNKELRKNTTGCSGAIESIIPRVINKVTELCENCVCELISAQDAY